MDAWFKARSVDLANQLCTTPNRKRGILSPEHLQALRRLQQDQNIVILRPNKGAGAVILNKEDYLTKMHSILADTERFQHETQGKDMTTNLERKTIDLVKQLKQKGLIDESTASSLKPRGSKLPVMYGLPKVHKEGFHFDQFCR
jgi:hypothetical protein